MILEVVAYALFMIYVARPLLLWWIHRFRDGARGELSITRLATMIALVLVSAVITNLIGIFSIFGGLRHWCNFVRSR